jgi:hypothetical protein
MHFSTIQLLNAFLPQALPLVDLSQASPVPGSLAHLLRSLRCLVFEATRSEPLLRCVFVCVCACVCVCMCVCVYVCV